MTEVFLLTLHSALLRSLGQQQLLILTDPVLAGVRDVLGGATTALTLTEALDTLPARTLPATATTETTRFGTAATDAKNSRADVSVLQPILCSST